MQLNPEALNSLKKILVKQFGSLAESFTDQEIEKLGIRLLLLTKFVLKRKANKSFSVSE